MKVAQSLIILAGAALGAKAAGSGLVPFTTTTTIASTGEDNAIVPGDIVAVNHGNYGRTEGLVVGSHIDYAGRQIIEVQLDSQEVYHAWYPTVSRVRRVVHAAPVVHHAVPVRKQRTVERHIYY